MGRHKEISMTAATTKLEEEIDKAWAEESERRIDEIESGKVQTVPGEQVFQEIRKRIKK
ncbi:hypothetical protein EOM81_10640 [bacterium]|nr:hypothetical protein [bacterium]